MSNKSAQGQDLDCVPTLSIKGSPDVKGTYFHPSIVTQVLSWVCEDLRKMIFDIFENAVVEQNQLIAYEEEEKTGL